VFRRLAVDPPLTDPARYRVQPGGYRAAPRPIVSLSGTPPSTVVTVSGTPPGTETLIPGELPPLCGVTGCRLCWAERRLPRVLDRA
jgi:hypothetical protein